MKNIIFFQFTLVGIKFTREDDILCKLGTKVLAQLHAYHMRKRLVPDKKWQIKSLKKFDLTEIPNAKQILYSLPFAVSFPVRYHFFRNLVAQVRQETGRSAIAIIIQRKNLVEDGYKTFMALSPHQMHLSLRIQFQNEYGLDEAGIDHGGLFKEFLIELIQHIFNPMTGLFLQNQDGGLYPNPSSVCIPDLFQLYRFLGRVLGKAIYEGITVDVPFAQFFLTRFLGKYNTIDELQTLDAEMYKHLMFLKHYEGDLEDLSLTFAALDNDKGNVPLVPGGDQIPVTKENKDIYIHLVAAYKLNKQINHQTKALLQGFQDVIPLPWIQLFNQNELQILISGDTGEIDVKDLQAHTVYSGGYTALSSTVRHFWEVLRELSPEQLRKFLKFVTSCTRPPMMGFRNLNPPFTITRVSAGEVETDFFDMVSNFFTQKKSPVRLPTASTCFNLLKLPDYSDKSLLKTKLIYAVQSNAGFDLS